MNKESLKLSILMYFPQILPEDAQKRVIELQQKLTEFLNTEKLEAITNISDIFLEILKTIIRKKIEDINSLKPLKFTSIERLFIDFLWLDMRLFKSGSALYDKIWNIIEENKFSDRMFFLTDFIRNEMERLTGLDEFFKENNEKKEYEKMLFKLEDERLKLSKLRENLLFKLGGENNQEIRKYITQSTKLEQEIPHIAEYNYKRKEGETITPQERNNLIRLEKQIDDDNEWRETILSNFVKSHPEIVQEIRKINKAIATILNKEGEILYFLNKKEKFLKKFQEDKQILDENKSIEVLDKIVEVIESFINSYSRNNFLPFQESELIIDSGFFEALDVLNKKEEKIIKHLQIRKKRTPRILFLPFVKDSFFEKERNLIILPVYSLNIIPLYKAFGLFKWNIDTLHDVKTEYQILRQNRGVDPNILEKKFIEKYILYMNDPEKFKSTTDIETKEFFERIFK